MLVGVREVYWKHCTFGLTKGGREVQTHLTPLNLPMYFWGRWGMPHPSFQKASANKIEKVVVKFQNYNEIAKLNP